MTFLITFYLSLFILWLLSEGIAYQFHEKTSKKFQLIYEEAVSSLLSSALISALVIFVTDQFLAGLVELLEKWWWAYLILFLLNSLHLINTAIKLPYLNQLEGLFTQEELVQKEELAEMRLDVQTIQTLAAQRLSLFVVLAPIGIVLPFLGETFKVSSLEQMELHTFLAWLVLVLCLMLLWENYRTFKRTTLILTAIDKQAMGIQVKEFSLNIRHWIRSKKTKDKDKA